MQQVARETWLAYERRLEGAQVPASQRADYHKCASWIFRKPACLRNRSAEFIPQRSALSALLRNKFRAPEKNQDAHTTTSGRAFTSTSATNTALGRARL